VADRLVPSAGLDPIHWTEPPPAVAVNLHGSGPQSHRLLAALNPWWLVGYASEEAGCGGPAWDPDEHEVDRWCRLCEYAGWTADRIDLALPSPISPPTVRDSVLVHPGAAYAARRWPPDRFAAVVRWLAEQGSRVVVTGSPGEAALAERICALADRPGVMALAGRTDLVELAALVASARLVVSGDTGVAHLASAYRRPSVVLFGPTPPARWGPPVDGPHTVLWHGKAVGDPFGSEPDPALLAIDVDEVVSAARLRLAA
jgi:ADP-heptose:LPS heptosyltransferase